ncbi:MAG: hypothetical protein IJW29_05560 [Clostridia bacterium]|nr:hypothetical protein [Clostridia bacterium]
MSKGSIAKWVAASIGFTAVAAFTAGVIYQINAIKKLNVNIDEDEDEAAEEVVEIVVEEVAEEEAAEEATEA